MEGKPFQVRTIIYGDKEEEKKTLVMTHGFMGASAVWIWMLKHLAERYRLVLFDHGSWGLNTRLDTCEALESPEAAENWQREWVLKLMDALTDVNTIPDKFYLAGHSMGGWLLS